MSSDLKWLKRLDTLGMPVILAPGRFVSVHTVGKESTNSSDCVLFPVSVILIKK